MKKIFIATVKCKTDAEHHPTPITIIKIDYPPLPTSSAKNVGGSDRKITAKGTNKYTLHGKPTGASPFYFLYMTLIDQEYSEQEAMEGKKLYQSIDNS